MASKKFLVPLGLVSLALDPPSGTEGDLYYNNISDVVRLYKNGAWTDLISAGAIPSGGQTGDILAKSSNADYEVEWIENFADYTELVKLRVKNDGIEPLYKGQAVYVTGSDGTNILIGKASNTTESSSSKTIGILEQNLAPNGIGFVVKEGKLATLDTSAAGAVGDPVWLGVDGGLLYGLASKPYGPANLVYLGIVTKKNGSTGEIFVHVQNGFELEELHNVGIGYGSVPQDSVLRYDSDLSLWKNTKENIITAKNVEESTVPAYTPVYINSQTVGLAEVTFLKADASIAAKMPATGITTQSVASAASSKIVMQGIVSGLTLTSYSDGDLLYIASGGGFTKVRPTGTNIIQPFGRVISVDNGSIYIYGNTFASSIESLPNLATGKVFLGTSGRPVETTLDTFVVPENTNLYFTDERAQDAAAELFTTGVHSGVSVEYNDSTGKLNITNTGVTALYGTTNEISVSGSTGGVTIGIPDSPVFVTPNIGVATATSINGTSIPSSKTLVVTTDIGSSVQAYDADLSSIAALTGTSGFLKTNGSGTWSVDTATYVTATDISNAVGDYIPLNQKGAPSGVAELDIDSLVPVAQIPVLTAYSLSTHNHSLNSLSNVVITGTPTDGQAIVWDTTTSKWVNETISAGGSSTAVSETAPPSPSTGNSWYKPSTGSFYVYDGTFWVEVTSVITMSDEEAQDKVAPLLNHASHVNITASYDDLNNKIILTSSHTETDPVFVASPSYGITTTNISNWDTAYGWGDHATPGYLTSATASTTYAALAGATFTGDISVNNGTSSAITTSSATATLFNANATTVKVGEAATVVSIGDINHVGTTTINNNLAVYGNITFDGGASSLSATTIQIDDTLISLADNNVDDILDIGFYAGYNDGVNNFHTGLVRDASDSGKWKLFAGVETQPTTLVDFTTATYGTLKIGALEVTDAATTRTNLGLGTMATATATDYLTTLAAGTTYAPLNSPTFTGTVTGITKSMVGLSNVENTALSTFAGSSNITTLGSITTGTWLGSAIGYAHGGTGLTTLGTAGQVLKVNATADALEWGAGGSGGGGTLVQETAPTSPTIGDTWFKNSESTLYIYDGSFWIEVNSLLTIPLEDIIELDNMSKQFNGAETRFLPTFNGNMVPITNPYRLLLTINGIIQEMGFPEYVWQSMLPRSGYRIDNDGYIAFSEAPPVGSTFHARILAGPTTNTTQKIYSFEAADILLGA